MPRSSAGGEPLLGFCSGTHLVREAQRAKCGFGVAQVTRSEEDLGWRAVTGPPMQKGLWFYLAANASLSRGNGRGWGHSGRAWSCSLVHVGGIDWEQAWRHAGGSTEQAVSVS